MVFVHDLTSQLSRLHRFTKFITIVHPVNYGAVVLLSSTLYSLIYQSLWKRLFSQQIRSQTFKYLTRSFFPFKDTDSAKYVYFCFTRTNIGGSIRNILFVYNQDFQHWNNLWPDLRHCCKSQFDILNTRFMLLFLFLVNPVRHHAFLYHNSKSCQRRLLDEELRSSVLLKRWVVMQREKQLPAIANCSVHSLARAVI